MPVGKIFSVEEFSVYDGPGIRTSVFFKGCPLRCSWCHNPEGQNRGTEIIKSPNGCLGCGECERYARNVGGRRVFTSESIKKCPMGLLRECGEEIDSETLVSRLMKNERVLRMNGGGVTFSGGEPLMQGGFLIECLELLRGRIHTAVQTSGYADSALFSRVLERADMFLYDLKIMDDAEHIFHTGVSNAKIIKNFRTLCASGVDKLVRIPLIPSVTDTEKNIRAVCELLTECGAGDVELLPYNKMAGGKYAMLGREYSPSFDASLECTPREAIFNEYGIKTKIL